MAGIMVQSKNIIVIDDSINFCDSLQACNRELGFEIKPYSSFSACQTVISEIQPFAVLVDLLMPGVDGVEVIEEVRRISANSKLYLVTGFKPKSSQFLRLEHAGAKYYPKAMGLNNLLVKLYEIAENVNHSSSGLSNKATIILDLQMRVDKQDGLLREFCSDLIDALFDQRLDDKPFLAVSGRSLTAQDVLLEIQEFSGIGEEIMESWRNIRGDMIPAHPRREKEWWRFFGK